MIQNSTPIVIVAYNRPSSLLRLLKSIARAEYPKKDIPLIISIDKADDNNEVLQVAKKFEWHFGEKKINYKKENLGLRKHVLQCGDLSQKYGSVIVLEDDLFVSSNFYNFAQAALEFSNNKKYIAGVSLYNHQLNVHTRDNFSPIEDGFDNWYFQFASSWGQIWDANQWQNFKEWYLNNENVLSSKNIPENVSNWSNKSWLKYYIAYLIETNRFFLYPKISQTSNFSDQGTHVGIDTTAFQVPLDYSKKKKFVFSNINESQSKYNAFYENIGLHDYLDISNDSICIDLYGYRKRNDQRFLLTTKILNFKIIKSFGKSLKPIDANIIENIAGNDILLYDTSVSCENLLKENIQRKIIYNIKHISEPDSKFMYRLLAQLRIKHKFNKLFKR